MELLGSGKKKSSCITKQLETKQKRDWIQFLSNYQEFRQS